MFLGYQEKIIGYKKETVIDEFGVETIVETPNTEEFIASVANTSEELENNEFVKYSRIEETSIEYKLINGSYIPITEAFEKAKQSKHIEINKARDKARINEGAEYDGDLFDIDETSQSNILAQIKVAELLNNAKATYIYRSKTNQNHSFTVTQLQELGLAIAQKVNEIYQKSWDLKSQVDNAKTEDELNKITW